MEIMKKSEIYELTKPVYKILPILIIDIIIYKKIILIKEIRCFQQRQMKDKLLKTINSKINYKLDLILKFYLILKLSYLNFLKYLYSMNAYRQNKI